MSLTLFILPIVIILAFVIMSWVYQSKALTFNARSALKKDTKRKFAFSKTGFIIIISSSFITLSCISVYSIYLYNVRTLTTRCLTPTYDSQIPELKLCANQFGHEIFEDTNLAYSVLNTKYQDEIPTSNVKVTPKNITTLRDHSNAYLNETFNYFYDHLNNIYDFHTNVMPGNQYGTYAIDGVWLLQFNTIKRNLNSSDVSFTLTNLTSSEQTLTSIYPILFIDGDFGVDPKLLEALNVTFEAKSSQQFNLKIPHTDSLTIRVNSNNLSYIHQGGNQ
ncbi:hypothetical protein H9L01_04540 [Erysipelothrix inopinata]|uniref:Uncharacterized protein n=1 Tax=Erysipelothrix inopinata TaxID=225084 RepID=A0A7G9S1A2_9FIRM|nr:hypothetical protein [Erysipelothrix inopinata]QNN61627.1 hypothetical protein H9L01_04540 [Erysipelothrix inopinata]